MIPNDVKYILKKLHSNNHEAYIVGGAVRNTVMDLPINDWDITTSATPDEVEALFDKTYSVGKAFGTVIVKLEHHYEVTTFRAEGEYDGRRPAFVAFSKDLKEDLKRRDFTMNAMVMDEYGEIFDIFNGLKDIKDHYINTVGDPKERFEEDYLRVYRYVRFTAQHDFHRNPTIDQVIQEMPINKNISVERIREEFNKIMLSEHASKGLRHLHDLGLLTLIIPEILPTVGFQQHSKFHYLTVFEHLLKAVDLTPRRLSYRLAALCHDLGKPETFQLIDGEGHFYGHDKASVILTDRFLKRLKYPNALIDEVNALVKYHMRLLDTDNKKSIKKFINKIGVERLEGYLALRTADILSSKTNDDISSVDTMRDCFEAIINEDHPMTINDLNIDGHQLMTLGITGRDIGIIKKALLELVLEHPDLNQTETLMKEAVSIKNGL